MTNYLMILFISILAACSSSDIQKGIEALKGEALNTKPDSKVIASGLREALIKGARYAGDELSVKGGFSNNQVIKILFPPEFSSVQKKLKSLGLGFLVDQAVSSFNRAAERASLKSFPIVVSAIKKMTIQDAMNILMGPDNAATEYLKKATTNQLEKEFLPIVTKSASTVEATKYWDKIVSEYNMIPFVKKLPEDINSYITSETVKGFFHVIEKEEKAIRKNPIQRTTKLLKSVFGYAEVRKSREK